MIFGEAVNLAAWLEGLGAPGDITMSKSFANDPVVSGMLMDYDLSERNEIIKGFVEPVETVQIKTLGNLMNAATPTWSLYIIEASDASLYTGITTDVERRFEEHLNCQRGAKYFNGRTPVKVVYREDGHTRSSASRREAEIKKLSRQAKGALIISQC